MRRLAPHPEINGYTMKIEDLLSHPDMRALIETTPAIARVLRPLCHLFGLRPPPHLALPPRARQTAKPSARPRPKPRRPARPARPAPIALPITSSPPPLGPGNHYFIPNPKSFKNR